MKQNYFINIFCIITISLTIIPLMGCGGGSSNTNNNKPPEIILPVPDAYSPSNGANTIYNPPPLLIYSIEKPDGIDVVYDFELYGSDSETPIAVISDLPENDSPYILWNPDITLPLRSICHWRARAAVLNGIKSPWMQKISFYLFDYRRNIPERCVAFGDSITGGYGSSTFGKDLPGYQKYLKTMLIDFYGYSEIITKWIPGGYTIDGATIMESVLINYKPSMILILFGTHDTVIAQVEIQDMINNINTMVTEAFARGTLPVLGTIPPVNPASQHYKRQAIIGEFNTELKKYCDQKGIILADINGYFWAAANEEENKLPQFFYDSEHSNDKGYEIMAQAWFDAIIAKN
ncbi:MAG: hypothetical protein A2161_14890 [Candidatus Schekmanbacteria bacterium RBG_13_48_7]|uniref:SGNH hydrolase-type esterase domain-containing protein n=1 Tax=Candidatus Schekmanbacteria bacterium RBG_13_48_7 TaxID=1817878 RepID=A0A1F7RXI4_9BACT|nr:MAG: hypothetical protein A2161_14890 [Candidatus Schekmanbacteria bacterium RBG_13_48_7]